MTSPSFPVSCKLPFPGIDYEVKERRVQPAVAQDPVHAIPTHSSFNGHDRPGTVAQVTQTGADSRRGSLDVQPILVVDSGSDIVLEVVGRDVDRDVARHLHGRPGCRADLFLGTGFARSRRIVAGQAFRGGLDVGSLRFDRASGFSSGHLGRLGQTLLAEVRNDLERRLSVNLPGRLRQ